MTESTFSYVCSINTCWKNEWMKNLSKNGNKSDHLGPCLKSISGSPSLMGPGWNLSPGQHGPAYSGTSWSLLPKMSPFCFSLRIPVFRFLQGLALSCYMVFHKLFSYPRTQLRPHETRLITCFSAQKILRAVISDIVYHIRRYREAIFANLLFGSMSLQMVTAAMKLKDTCSLEEKLWPI